MLPLQPGRVTLTPGSCFIEFPVTLHRHRSSTSSVLGKENVTILAFSFFYIKKKKTPSASSEFRSPGSETGE